MSREARAAAGRTDRETRSRISYGGGFLGTRAEAGHGARFHQQASAALGDGGACPKAVGHGGRFRVGRRAPDARPNPHLGSRKLGRQACPVQSDRAMARREGPPSSDHTTCALVRKHLPLEAPLCVQQRISRWLVSVQASQPGIFAVRATSNAVPTIVDVLEYAQLQCSFSTAVSNCHFEQHRRRP